MTAVASAPTFPQINRPSWGTFNGSGEMNSDELRGMFAARKALARSNSSSSMSSDASNSSASTVGTNGSQVNGTPLSATSELSQWSAGAGVRKRPQPANPWPTGKGEVQPDFSRLPAPRPNGLNAPLNSLPPVPGQPQMTPQAMARPMPPEQLPPGQPVLYLLSLNGTFERKTIAVPYAPDSLRIGRQTNQKTIPTSTNGFFDSKVLSRQHAEIYAERNGKIYIRDVKSSNGTFVNGTRLSQENRESEPHELQTADHLELGIDIVSEDQKTVVHHKVAAKVEHAGFLSTSNNVMDMNFGDLDPANGAMMMPAGAVQMRGRAWSNGSMVSNGRMMNGGAMAAQANGVAQQRPFFVTPIATDQILKRLTNEMRNARIQSQDLTRTHRFINTLLSKDDIKDLEKPEGPEPPTKPQAIVNGHALPFRTDPKTRFSEPPNPPPQQPLPEKPDVPSLKRGPTERPKSGPPNTSPVRPENINQIIQLTEALNNAKRDFDTQTARMRELETMLQKEREARALAEDLAKRLEESSTLHMNGAVKPDSAVEQADNQAESGQVAEETRTNPAVDHEVEESSAAVEAGKEVSSTFLGQLEAAKEEVRGEMREEILGIQKQLEHYKQRCTIAETERDADRKTLAEMVVQLRAEEARRVAQEKARSRSRKRRADGKDAASGETGRSSSSGQPSKEPSNNAQSDGAGSSDDLGGEPTLSRANTITPRTALGGGTLQERHLQAGLPYASMVGVVLIGMGLMAYINGWQTQPPSIER